MYFRFIHVCIKKFILFIIAERYCVVRMYRHLSICSSVHGYLHVSSFWHLLIELYVGFCAVMVFSARYSLLVYV